MNQLVPSPTVFGVESVLSIPLDYIEVGERLRVVDPARVDVLKHSILANRSGKHSGLLQPIQVRPVPGVSDRYQLVAGAHRLAAIRAIGDTSINAVEMAVSELQARLVEIDENLCRHELTAFDRAAFLAERKRVYEELHPETKKGRAGALARWTDANDKMSFASDAAEKAGLSVRQIQRDIKVWLSLSPESRARIPGTWLADHQGQLKALSKLGPTLQAQVVEALLRGENPAANVAAAKAEIEGHRPVQEDTTDAGFKKLLATWNRASARDRNAFLCHLADEGVLKTFMDGE